MFWVRLVLRTLFYAALIGIGLWVYYRGLEGWIEDCIALGRFWLQEYEGFKSDVRTFQAQKEEQLLRERREREVLERRRGGWW